MARGIRIRSNAVFNPFSYQELMAPLTEYDQAYAQMQDNLLAMGEEANQWKQYIDNDEWASNILTGYNTALQDAATRLANEGLRGTNRNTLLSLRKAYNDKVKPVNDAAKSLANLQETYRQMYAKDPTMLRGAMPTIQELVYNPGAMPVMTSGTSLYNQGTKAAQSASSRNRNFQAKMNDLVAGYIHTVETAGYDSEEARRFLDAASRQPELQAIFNQIYAANNVGRLEDPSVGSEWILRGLLDGMTYEQKDNLMFNQYAAEMRAAAREKAKADKTSPLNAYIKPYNIYSQNEVEKAATNIRNYEKYFTQKADGTWKINEEGIKQYNKQGVKHPEHGVYGRYVSENSFKDFIDSLTSDGTDASAAWENYYNEHKHQLYDATKDTGYRFIPQSDDATELLKLIQAHGQNADGDMYSADYNRDLRGYQDTKDKIKANDLKTIADIGITPAGIVANALDKDNKKVQVMVPKTISPMHYNAATTNAGRLASMELELKLIALNYGFADMSPENISELYWTASNRDGEQAAAAVLERYRNYEDIQRAMYNSFSGLYRPINTKPEEL